jgi:hypothetical protein
VSEVPRPPPTHTHLLTKTNPPRYPQFGEQSQRGGFAQQDAQEFLNSLFTSTALSDDASIAAAFGGEKPDAKVLNGAQGLTNSMFGLKVRSSERKGGRRAWGYGGTGARRARERGEHGSAACSPGNAACSPGSGEASTERSEQARAQKKVL